MGVIDTGAMNVGAAARDLGVDEGGQEVWTMVDHCFPGATLSNGSDVILRQRIGKSDAELDLVDHATAIALVAADAMMAAMRPGVADHDLVAVAASQASRWRAERILVLIAVGTRCPVSEPCGATWRAVEPVQTEITLCAHGYLDAGESDRSRQGGPAGDLPTGRGSGSAGGPSERQGRERGRRHAGDDRA